MKFDLDLPQFSATPLETGENKFPDKNLLQKLINRNFQRSLRKAEKNLVEAQEHSVGRLYYPMTALLQIDHKVTYETLERAWHTIEGNTGHYLMILFLLEGVIRDDETGCPMLPNEVIRTLCNDYTDSLPLLTRTLNQMGIIIETEGRKDRNSIITRLEFPDALKTLRMQIWEVPRQGDELFWLATGRKVSRTTEKAQRNRLSQLSGAPTEIASGHKVIDILNRPSKSYEQLRRIAPELIEEIRKSDNPTSPKSRRDMCFLRKIHYSPQPIYHQVNKTSRIFTRNGYPALSRDTRKTLIERAGWIELDLKSAQLVITRNLFDVQPLDQYLTCEEGFWMRMLEEVGLERNDLNKANLKTCIYRVIFGGSLNRVINHEHIKEDKVKKELITEEMKEMANRLIKHPLIKAISSKLLDDRKQIKETGYIVDAYERKYDKNHRIIEETENFKKEGNITNIEARSLQARKIQSYEYRILEETLSIAEERIKFQLVGWIHDSIVLKARGEAGRKVRREWQRSLTEAEARIWNEYGITEYLELELSG